MPSLELPSAVTLGRAGGLPAGATTQLAASRRAEHAK